MPDYLNQVKIKPDGTAKVTIQQETNGLVWQIEQISGAVGNLSSNPSITILKNGYVVAPTSAMVPGPNGLSQTASGLPYLYAYALDFIDVICTGGISGDLFTVRAQYREYNQSHPDMWGR